MAKKNDTPAEAPYESVKMSAEEFEKVEDRQPDQIADYHQTHPTLKAEKTTPEAPVE